MGCNPFMEKLNILSLPSEFKQAMNIKDSVIDDKVIAKQAAEVNKKNRRNVPQFLQGINIEELKRRQEEAKAAAELEEEQ